jgi:hypothetical protein
MGISGRLFYLFCVHPVERKKEKWLEKGISDLLLAGFFLLQMKSPRHRGQLMDQFCTPVELSSSHV